MTDVTKVLPFDRSQIGQETGYWCGPATTQSALKIRGINVAEREIARQTEELEGNIGWDDQDGTDYIGQLAVVLNRYLGEGTYVVRDLPKMPNPTWKKQIWDEIVLTIDSGFGVPTNWQAPPSNYPVGRLGSLSPNYGGGTVFHYVLVDGYAVIDGILYIHIADSGFWPDGYWITFEQYVSLTVPKSYLVLGAESPIDAAAVNDFIRIFVGPIASDVRDIRSQLVTRWPHLGNRDLKTAVGDLVGR